MTPRRSSHSAARRKTQQLCAQIERTLHYVLGSVGDGSLADLLLEHVNPGADGSHVIVLLRSPTGPADPTPDDWLARLAVARGELRGEVAASINRKRVPDLHFVVLPAESRTADPD